MLMDPRTNTAKRVPSFALGLEQAPWDSKGSGLERVWLSLGSLPCQWGTTQSTHRWRKKSMKPCDRRVLQDR